MYLEISGRATGKTTRLIDAAHRYLSEDEKNIANLIFSTKESAEMVKKKIGENKRIRYTMPERKDPIIRGYANARNFFDEFDWMKLDFEREGAFFYTTTKEDYYVTTPRFVRHMDKTYLMRMAKDDLLLRLLCENKGVYNSAVSLSHDPSWLEPMKEAIVEKAGQEIFDREIRGVFLEY